jgi:hypothetical protein
MTRETVSRFSVPAPDRAGFGLKPSPLCGSLASTYPAIVRKALTSTPEYAGQSFDYVLTVCDNAKESCPIFSRPDDQDS